MTYIYIATKQANPKKRIAGVLQARHSFEALHNARFLVSERGGNIRLINLIKI